MPDYKDQLAKIATIVRETDAKEANKAGFIRWKL